MGLAGNQQGASKAELDAAVLVGCYAVSGTGVPYSAIRLRAVLRDLRY